MKHYSKHGSSAQKLKPPLFHVFGSFPFGPPAMIKAGRQPEHCEEFKATYRGVEPVKFYMSNKANYDDFV